MSGVIFDSDSAARISRAVRRVERMPLENPTDDGTVFPPVPAPIFVEVRITGEGLSGGSGPEGGSSGSGCGADDFEIWPAVTLVWNGCGWDDGDAVWVFSLDDDVLREGHKYLTRVIDSHFTPSGSAQRPLCEAFIGIGEDEEDEGSDTGSGDMCPPGSYRITLCFDVDGVSTPRTVCQSIEGNRIVYRDADTGEIIPPD